MKFVPEKGIFFASHRSFIPVTGIVFLTQEFYSCPKNDVSVTGILLLWPFFPCVTEILFSFMFLMDFSYCDQEPLHVTGNSFLWNGFSSYDKYLNHVKGIMSCNSFVLTLFLWQDISSCDRKSLLVTENVILQQEISSHLITARKCGDSHKDFLWGLSISCHLGCQDARKKLEAKIVESMSMLLKLYTTGYLMMNE